MIKKRIEINGIKTAISIREGRNPVIVCIHGNSFSQRLFSPLWNDEKLMPFGMLSYDFPGHGESGEPEFPESVYSMAGYAAHLEQLLKALSLKDVVLLGFSYGGHLANEAAGNNISASVRGICTIGSPPLDNLEDFQKAFLPLPDGASLFVKDISVHHRRCIVDSMTLDESVKPVLHEDMEKSAPAAREFLFKSIAECKFHSEHDFLRNIRIPVLFLFGENDRMINPEYVREERIRTLLGNRLKICKDAYHLPGWHRSESYMEEFHSFMEQFIG